MAHRNARLTLHGRRLLIAVTCSRAAQSRT
jgi:hypothetical protein